MGAARIAGDADGRAARAAAPALAPVDRERGGDALRSRARSVAPLPGDGRVRRERHLRRARRSRRGRAPRTRRARRRARRRLHAARAYTANDPALARVRARDARRQRVLRGRRVRPASPGRRTRSLRRRDGARRGAARPRRPAARRRRRARGDHRERRHRRDACRAGISRGCSRYRRSRSGCARRTACCSRARSTCCPATARSTSDSCPCGARRDPRCARRPTRCSRPRACRSAGGQLGARGAGSRAAPSRPGRRAYRLRLFLFCFLRKSLRFGFAVFFGEELEADLVHDVLGFVEERGDVGIGRPLPGALRAPWWASSDPYCQPASIILRS